MHPYNLASSKCVFSIAGNLISKKHTRISSENVHYVLCLQSLGILHPDKDKEEIIINKDSSKIVQVLLE
jgi:hypothetical protein